VPVQSEREECLIYSWQIEHEQTLQRAASALTGFGTAESARWLT
jgi:hypothetical protein